MCQRDVMSELQGQLNISHIRRHFRRLHGNFVDRSEDFFRFFDAIHFYQPAQKPCQLQHMESKDRCQTHHLGDSGRVNINVITTIGKINWIKNGKRQANELSTKCVPKSIQRARARPMPQKMPKPETCDPRLCGFESSACQTLVVDMMPPSNRQFSNQFQSMRLQIMLLTGAQAQDNSRNDKLRECKR
jgi:hypothetical protein